MTKTALENRKLETQVELQKDKHRHETRENRLERKFKADENAKQREHDKRRGRAANWTKVGVEGMKMAGAGIAALAANDPEWYKKYIPNLFEFTNVPTYERVGSSTYLKLAHKRSPRPGIMVIPYANVIGTQDAVAHADSPINQILMRSKEMVLKLNSRSNVNWEPGDLGFNFLVSGSIIQNLAYCKKILEIYRTYRGDNAYLASDVIRAHSIAYPDLQDNYASYRKRYATVVERFNKSIVAPRELSYFLRKWYLGYGLFVDHPLSSNLVRQIYFYQQCNTFRLESTGLKVLSEDVFDVVGNTTRTLGSLFSIIEAQIQSITENSDFVEMYADLRAAFGENLFQVSPDIGDFAPINDVEMNRIQIHNTKTLPWMRDNSNSLGHPKLSTWLNVEQDASGWLVSNGGLTEFEYSGDAQNYVSGGAFTSAGQIMRDRIKGRLVGQLCDSPHEVVDGNEILDMTRMMAVLDDIRIHGTNDVKYRIAACGTEVPLGYIIYHITASVLTRSWGGTVVFDGSTSTTTLKEDMSFVCYESDFDWMPECTHLYDTSTDGYVHFDMYHAFAIDNDTLSSIHEACILSEFYLQPTSFTGGGR